MFNRNGFKIFTKRTENCLTQYSKKVPKQKREKGLILKISLKTYLKLLGIAVPLFALLSCFVKFTVEKVDDGFRYAFSAFWRVYFPEIPYLDLITMLNQILSTAQQKKTPLVW